MDTTNRQQYLPSKKILWVVIPVVAVVGVVTWYQTSSRGLNLNNLTTSGNEQQDDRLADDDNDGLKNYEEELWGTDPQNPDTDGDGTEDGAEVANQRDPLKANDDELNSFTTQTETGNEGSQESVQEPNDTGQVLSEILPEATMMANANLEGEREVSQEDLNNLVNEAAQGLQSYQGSYSEEDLVISSQVNTETYTNNALEILQKYAESSPIGQELSMFSGAVPSNNQAIYEELESLAVIYDALADELSNVAVPPSESGTHLEIINNYKVIAQTVRDMARFEEDPVRALQGIGTYQRITRSQDQAMTFIYNN